MNNLDKIYNHPFTLELLKDQPLNADAENCSEQEYYINNSNFYFVHLMALLTQLDNAVVLLNNFGYSQKTKVSRADHLTYNVENYMIRVVSITDRVLQLINMIYYLKVDESKVNYKKIIENQQIRNSSVKILFLELKQLVANYSNDRNSVVHRHSYIDRKLYQLQSFYHIILTEKFIKENSELSVKNFKNTRSQALKKFTEEMKEKFAQTNDRCFSTILQLLDPLLQQYRYNKEKLK